MSEQDQGQGIDYDERCENCNDPLTARQNWAINDVQTNLLYCTKEECQESKPEIITTKSSGVRIKRFQPKDKGLSHELKEKRRYVRYPADAARVADFAKMLEDERMWNEKGFPRYSKIFKDYGVNDPELGLGYECIEMATAQYPDEVDSNGCISIHAVNAVKNYLKRLTKRYQGMLEIYSTRVVKETEPYKGRRVWRWHTLKNRGDLDKQTNDMLQIARSIELAARKRENNFTSKTYEERMAKVDLLNEFFE